MRQPRQQANVGDVFGRLTIIAIVRLPPHSHPLSARRLTELLVLEIRGRFDHGQRSSTAIAKWMGIDRYLVRAVLEGRSWVDVQ